jgi:hypothetical protein
MQKFEFSDNVKANLTYDQQTYIMQGQRKSQQLTEIVDEALGTAPHILVKAKYQTMIYGPPGVGKSYTTAEFCRSKGVIPVRCDSEITPSGLVQKFAVAEAATPPGQEIAVVWDDADKFLMDSKIVDLLKQIFQDDRDVACLPYDKNLTGEILKLRATGRNQIADAICKFMPTGSTGVFIPLKRFRHIVLTNKNYTRLSQVNKTSYLAPIVDRFDVHNLDYDWKTAWGWLAMILLTSQPFQKEGYPLTENQKIKIITWLYDKWEGNMLDRDPSYRTVRTMAEHVINHPVGYLDKWAAALIKPTMNSSK